MDIKSSYNAKFRCKSMCALINKEILTNLLILFRIKSPVLKSPNIP